MLRMTCTHNMWGILSTDQHGDQIYAQSPNKRHNLTLSVRADLSVCALFQETEYLIDRLPGSNVVHKLTLFLSVICDPIKLTRTWNYLLVFELYFLNFIWTLTAYNKVSLHCFCFSEQMLRYTIFPITWKVCNFLSCQWFYHLTMKSNT